LQREAHLAAGMAAASIVAWLLNAGLDAHTLAVIVGGLASLLPDLDLAWRHRMLLHNLTVTAVLIAAVWLAWSRLGLPYKLLATASFAAGYLSHILLDMLTVRGVALLYPYTRRRYRLLKLRTSDRLANHAITLLSTVVLLATLSYRLLKP
jgi:inner membrane protein